LGAQVHACDQVTAGMHKRGGGAPPAGGCGSDMSVAAAYAAGESYSAPATPRRQWQRERPDEVRHFDTWHDSTLGALSLHAVCESFTAARGCATEPCCSTPAGANQQNPPSRARPLQHCSARRRRKCKRAARRPRQRPSILTCPAWTTWRWRPRRPRLPWRRSRSRRLAPRPPASAPLPTQTPRRSPRCSPLRRAASSAWHACRRLRQAAKVDSTLLSVMLSLPDSR